jgi:hypothetical protein
MLMSGRESRQWICNCWADYHNLCIVLLKVASRVGRVYILPPSQGIRRPCFACFFFDQNLEKYVSIQIQRY